MNDMFRKSASADEASKTRLRCAWGNFNCKVYGLFVNVVLVGEMLSNGRLRWYGLFKRKDKIDWISHAWLKGQRVKGKVERRGTSV